MSTTIKRIALVAVAALSLGVVSVAPSQAAANTLIKFTAGDGAAGTDLNTGNGVAGAFNYVTVTAETWSAGTDYVVTTDSAFLGATGTSTIATDKKSLVSAAGANVIQVATPAVGTVTVSYWKRTAGVLASTAAETVVITVNASKQSGSFSAANSTAYVVKGETYTAISATADVAVTDLATADASEASATIAVVLKDALKGAIDDTVTATVISGGANVRVLDFVDSVTTTITGNVTPGVFSASALTTEGMALVFVHANGTSGPSQIKITLSDGTVVATKTVTFSSTTVATLTPTVVYKYVNGTKTGAVTVVAKDGQGYVVPGAAVTATSATTTKISTVTCTEVTDEDGSTSCDAVAVAAAAGDAVITFKSGVATATATLTAAGVKATKLSIVPSATSAEAGSKITYTLTLADANGPIADGVYVSKFFSAPVTSNGGTGAFAADTVTVLNGSATADIYLPFVSGTYTSTWTLKGTAATASAVASGTDNVDATIAGSKVVVDVVVTNAGVDAATEAASEAAQAASDATDAALAAADAADAATTKAQEAVDAVATLSAEVTKLVTALKAQITTLSNLVTKIAKKVKA